MGGVTCCDFFARPCVRACAQCDGPMCCALYGTGVDAVYLTDKGLRSMRACWFARSLDGFSPISLLVSSLISTRKEETVEAVRGEVKSSRSRIGRTS